MSDMGVTKNAQIFLDFRVTLALFPVYCKFLNQFTKKLENKNSPENSKNC